MKYMERSICRYYSHSQGRCFPVRFINGKEEYQDVSKCPVITSGRLCQNFVYYGDIFGDIDGKRIWKKNINIV